MDDFSLTLRVPAGKKVDVQQDGSECRLRFVHLEPFAELPCDRCGKVERVPTWLKVRVCHECSANHEAFRQARIRECRTIQFWCSILSAVIGAGLGFWSDGVFGSALTASLSFGATWLILSGGTE